MSADSLPDVDREHAQRIASDGEGRRVSKDFQMIFISCQFETPVGRSDYSDYVRALRLEVFGCDAVGDRILLGRIAADQVLVGDARTEGMSLFDVCDQDSQGLHNAYVALFDEQGEFQPDLRSKISQTISSLSGGPSCTLA